MHLSSQCYHSYRSIRNSVCFKQSSATKSIAEMATNNSESLSFDTNDELSDIVEGVCSDFGIDIRGDPKHKVLWNIVRTKHVEINDDLCNLMGMSEETILSGIRRFLDETVHIENENGVPNGTRCESNFIAFEKFLVQINAMNTILLLSMCKNARIECLENENERLRSSRRSSVSTLRNEIAPLVTPKPTNKNKIPNFGLFNIGERVWYIVRRQEESWDQHLEKLREQYSIFTKVRVWRGVSHAVNFGNKVKKELVDLKWIKKGGGNELELIEATITDQDFINKIVEIVNRKNDAVKLAESLEAESE